MEKSSLGGKKQKSAHLTDRKLRLKRVGGELPGSQSRVCTELVPDSLPFCVHGLVLSFLALAVSVCPRESLFIVSNPGMWNEGGNGKGEPCPLFHEQVTQQRGRVHRQKPSRATWSCCPVWSTACPQRTRHPILQVRVWLKGGTQLDAVVVGKTKVGFLEEGAPECTRRINRV